MTSYNDNNDSEKHKNRDQQQKKEATESKEGNSFLGIKFSNQETEQNNNLFGIPTYSPQQNSTETPISTNSSPAFRAMLGQLENAVRANKFDRDTIEIFRQISQLSNIDSILKESTLINMATISNLRDKEQDLTREQIQQNQNTKQPSQEDKKIIDDIELKKMQAEFLGSRENYQKSLEEKDKDLVINPQIQGNQHQ